MATIDMTTAPAAIAKARAAGYSDDEIVKFLSDRAPEQFKQARDAGYSAGDILGHLSGGQPDQPTAPDQPKTKDLSWGDVASEALANAPESAGNLISDVARAVVHPIDTATNIGNIGLGLLEKTGLSGSILPPTGGGHEKYADAVGQYFAERYGGLDKFKRALASD